MAEVASAGQRLDGIRNVVLTTGTPPTPDRGAEVLAESAAAIKMATGLPIQAQCEPPADFAWFSRLDETPALIRSGLHLEAWDEDVLPPNHARQSRSPAQLLSPGIQHAAVKVFGRGQVSTYLLAGLGDSIESLHEAARTLIDLGVYPFIVPFVPR